MLYHAAAQASEGSNIFLPPLGELVLSAIIVLLVALALVKFALPKYNQLVDERARIIREGVEATERAKNDAADAAAKAAEAITAAQQEAAQIREAAHDDGNDIISEARKRAKLEGERIAEAAQRQIAADRKAAQVSLRNEVGELAAELADRIVGEHLKDEALSARVIDRFLDDIDAETGVITNESQRQRS